MIQATAEPNVYKTVQASAAGNTALWTPATGRKFRLMRYKIDFFPNCILAARGLETVTFQDGSTPIPGIAADCWLGQTAPVEAAATIPQILYTTGWVDLANGVLSAAANNVLNVNLGTALAGGTIRVNVAGTEDLP